jgi:hypothetical protein
MLHESGPNAANEAARSALALRNRICQLLYQKMKLVQDAAGFVFQDYPEVRRQATSAYLRRQRSAARRAKTSEPAEAVGSTPTEDWRRPRSRMPGGSCSGIRRPESGWPTCMRGDARFDLRANVDPRTVDAAIAEP